MALATQCPHCKTTFRVAQDQLKLRAGLVRCGSCKEIFNGIEHLLAPNQTLSQPPAPAPTPAPAAKIAEPAVIAPVQQPVHAPAHVEEPVHEPAPQHLHVSEAAAPISAGLDFVYPVEPEPEPEPEPVHEPAPELDPDSNQREATAEEFVDFVDFPKHVLEAPHETILIEDVPVSDPLQRMTLVDFTDTIPSDEPYIADIEPGAENTLPQENVAVQEHVLVPPVDPDAPDPLDEVIDELKRKPMRKKKPKPYTRRPTQDVPAQDDEPEIAEPDEPEFVKQGRRKQTVGRSMRIAMGLTSFLFLLGAVGQTGYAFRDQIAVRWPEAKPVLLSACALLDCKVELPTQIESISIESDQLETLNTNKDASVLTMLLRNASTTTQAWPNLELTLNDGNNTMLSRRVFSPHEYLSTGQDEKKGLAASSEQTIKLYFGFSGSKPAGYHVGVFYP